jgi:dTDP-4-dehydrorhamnose 3,5-epimerase-like enzyme
MPYEIILQTYKDERGSLTVMEKAIPFAIKRIFYIYGVDGSERGKHRHHKTTQAAVCIKGSCKIYCHDGKKENVYLLDEPYKCLIIEAKDWHKMYDFSKDAILIVIASEEYNPEDYIAEPYA